MINERNIKFDFGQEFLHTSLGLSLDDVAVVSEFVTKLAFRVSISEAVLGILTAEKLNDAQKVLALIGIGRIYETVEKIENSSE